MIIIKCSSYYYNNSTSYDNFLNNLNIKSFLYSFPFVFVQGSTFLDKGYNLFIEVYKVVIFALDFRMLFHHNLFKDIITSKWLMVWFVAVFVSSKKFKARKTTNHEIISLLISKGEKHAKFRYIFFFIR